MPASLPETLGALGFALVAADSGDLRGALRAHAPCVVVVDGASAGTAMRGIGAVVQAQRFVQPWIVIGEASAVAADIDVDLVVPASMDAGELASHIRRIVDDRPRQILREHRRVLATLPRPAWLTDPDGKIAGINAPAEEILGVSASAALGRPWDRLLGDALAKKHRWLFNTRRTGVRAEVGVIELRGAGGALRKIECVASGLWAGAPDGGGTFAGTLVLCTDVTQARSIDLRMIQATKMEAIGRLASGVAHDFNNLLSVVIGSAQLVRHDLGEQHPSIEDLREIENAGMRAAQMTKQLLVFSRNNETELTTFDVGPMIRNTGKMLRRLLTERVQLELKLADAPLGILADVGQLEQVLVNLAVNARDAMPDGGRLVISAEPVSVREDDATWPLGVTPGEWIQLCVEDEGTGMTAETLEQAFEPFFTTKPKDQGTGLGLSVVYGIVKRFNGHIDVRSIVGQGTRFRILFRHAVELASQPARAASVMRQGGERILLVEDDDMVRRYLTRTLEAYGYAVLPVPDGKTALQVAASFPKLDLLVTDMGLPGMAGPEVAVSMRERFPELPAIYISGHIDTAQLESFLRDHDSFLAKPIKASRFLEEVRLVLDRSAR